MSQKELETAGSFKPWPVGGIAAVLMTMPVVAAIGLGCFVRLPMSPLASQWMAEDAAQGRAPPAMSRQILAMVALLILAFVFGAAGSAIRRRRAAYDRHPAAQAARGGLQGFVAMYVGLAILSYVAFGGRSLWYAALGSAGDAANAVFQLSVLFAIVASASLARADTRFGHLVWRLARVPSEFTLGRPPAYTGSVWSPFKIGLIIAGFGIAWLLLANAQTLIVTLAGTGPENSRPALAVGGGIVLVAIVGLLCAIALLLSAIQEGAEQEERAVLTQWRSSLFVRQPWLAGLLVAFGIGLAGSLTMHSGALEILDAAMTEQLFAWRQRISPLLAKAPNCASVAHLNALPRPLTPAELRRLITAVHEDRPAATVLLMSFEDAREQVAKGGGSFEEEIRALDTVLEQCPEVFFLVEGEETDPRRWGLHNANAGRFEADCRDLRWYFRAYLSATAEGEIAPSLAALLAARVLGIPAEQVFSRGTGELHLGPATISLDDRGRALFSSTEISFRGPGETVAPELVELVKPVLPEGGYETFYAAPYWELSDPDCPIYALAQAVDALVGRVLTERVPEASRFLTARRIVEPAPEWISILLLWAMCLWGGVMSVSFKPWYAAILTLHLVALLLLGSVLVIAVLDLAVMPTVPLLAMLAVWVGGSHATQALVERRRNQVAGVFGRYVSQQVADQVLQQQEVTLGGESRRVTVLFADIRGFGRIAEHLGPEELVALVNEHFSVMIDAVFEYSGTLDKFIGDAVMAVWGAPVQRPGDTANAVRAAVAIRDHINELAQRRTAEGQPVVEVAIGVNTGEVVAGNIGDVRRMEYTVMGDEVVVAARLQEIASHGPAYIVIGESTYEEVRDFVEVRSLGTVQVRHRERPVAIYELVSLR